MQNEKNRGENEFSFIWQGCEMNSFLVLDLPVVDQDHYHKAMNK